MSPVFLSITVLHILFLLAFSIPERFGALPDLVAYPLVVALHGLYVFILYQWFGHALHWLSLRNIPWSVSLLLFFAVIGVAEWALGALVLPVELGGSRGLWYLSQGPALYLPAVAICLLYYERSARALMADPPEALPYWRPVPRAQNLLVDRLPQSLRAPVLRIEAANQYVLVTTERGAHEFRMPMQEAIALMPEDSGVRIHRSVWLDNGQIGQLTYRNGNPKVVDPQGRIWPASRGQVEAIRRAMAHRSEARA